MKTPIFYPLLVLVALSLSLPSWSQQGPNLSPQPAYHIKASWGKYLGPQGANFQRRAAVLPRTLEDWEATGSGGLKPTDLVFGFSHVNDSLIWASTIDLGGFFGIPGPLNKFVSKSTDGGMTWESVRVEFADTSLTLSADSVLSPIKVFAVNDSLVFAVLYAIPQQNYGKLARSTDGGATWAPVPGDSSILPVTLYFSDPDTGVVFVNGFPPVVPQPVQIFYTEDGGQSFTNVSPPLDSAEYRWFTQVESLYEVKGDTLWYGTRHGRILRSLNKGKDWEVFETGYSPYFNVFSISFSDHLNGLIVLDGSGFEGIVPTLTLRTRDGGATWERIRAPGIIESLEYVPGSGGVFIGTGGNFGRPGIVITKDYGQSWSYDIPTLAGALASFTGPDKGFIGETNFAGGALKYVGPPLMADPNQADAFLFEEQGLGSLPDGYFLFALHAVNESVAWGVANLSSAMNPPVDSGHSPIVIKTTDGGATWESHLVEEIQGRICFDLFAFDEDTVWLTTQNLAPGDGRGAFVSYDGGETWEEKYNDVSAGVWIRWFGRQEGIVINRNSMARTLDGGQSWTQVPASAIPGFADGESTILNSGTNSLASVGDHLWFGTSLGKVYRSQDRGTTWQAFQALPDSNGIITTLAFRDTLYGLATAPLDENFDSQFPAPLLRTSDGGETWETLPPFPNPVRALAFVPGTENTFTAASFSDQYFAYSLNGGESWVFAEDIHPYRAIAFTGPGTGWAVNSTLENSFFGPVLKYIGEPFPAKSTVSSRPTLNQVNVKVYPNPVRDWLTVESEKNIRFIGLVNIHGQRISLPPADGNTWRSKLSSLPAGTYWLEVGLDHTLYYQLLSIE